MTVAAAAERHERAGTSAHCCAFGIGITAPVQLMASPSAASAGGRSVVFELGSAAELDAAWRPGTATRVLERRRRDGRLVMAVDHDLDRGYRVYAPHNGRHLVSPDGSRVYASHPIHALWRWQRLLLAQVLPLAATLQGLELLHASAVEWNDRAFCLVAPSGTGKSSVAAHVVARGGVLVTDDVLALETTVDGALAHPGAASLSIDPAELRRMPACGRRRLGCPVGRAEKTVLATEVATDPTRLDRMYFLERPSSRRLRIVPLSPDPVRLLASSFNTYVRAPERIVNQLAVIDRLVQNVPAFSVRIPAGEDASSVARAIVAHGETR